MVMMATATLGTRRGGGGRSIWLVLLFCILTAAPTTTAFGSSGVDSESDASSSTSSSSLRGGGTTTKTAQEEQLQLQEQQVLFQAWSTRFGKTYAPHDDERARRFTIWRDNHSYIQAHNNNNDKSSSYRLGHNEYSDLTLEEFQAYFKLGTYSGSGRNRPHRTAADAAAHNQKSSAATAPLPPHVDWVAAGAVPEVKNQGMCGSCWAFSAIGAIEARHYLDTGALIALSEQQLVDCDKQDLGCQGGLMDNAFAFDEYNATGICSSEDYPYVGHRRWFRGCKSEKGLCTAVEHTQVANFTDVNNTEVALMQALAQQPVSVAIQANLRSFQFYKSGVYDDPDCGNDLDHGVLAVGYGIMEDSNNNDPNDDDDDDNNDDKTTTAKPYFTIRNSWGPSWGDAGYIKMLRGKDAIARNVNGTCGLLGWASRPALRDDDDGPTTTTSNNGDDDGEEETNAVVVVVE